MAKKKAVKKKEVAVEQPKKESIVLIDVKVSGTSKAQNGITEIALLILNDKNREIGYYHTLVQPYNQEGSEKEIKYSKKNLSEQNLTVEQLEKDGKPAELTWRPLAELRRATHPCMRAADIGR